jgi:hypothetical protein
MVNDFYYREAIAVFGRADRSAKMSAASAHICG